METQRAYSMRDAYAKVYLNEEENARTVGSAHHSPTDPYRPIPFAVRPLALQVNRPVVNIDVTREYVGPGGVEKAYYTYPAGFDPTNREDVTRAGKAASNVKEDTEVTNIEVVCDYLIEAGLVDCAESAEAFFNHMSEEWVQHILKCKGYMVNEA